MQLVSFDSQRSLFLDARGIDAILFGDTKSLGIVRNAKNVHYLVHLPVTTKCHVLLLHETAVKCLSVLQQYQGLDLCSGVYHFVTGSVLTGIFSSHM